MAAKFAHHRNDWNWETFTQRREIARISALFKAYIGERAWKAIGDKLKRPSYVSRVDHERKIRSRKQKTDIRKCSLVNRTIQLWNQIPADALGTFSCKSSNFRKGFRQVINKAKWMCEENHPKMKWIVARMWRARKCGEAEWREVYGEMWVYQFMTLSVSLLLLFSV
jgi:hypothetical protein